VEEAERSDARDDDLLSRVGHGDEEAFRSLFRRYGATAHALAQRVVRRGYLAEETVQEAFLALWRNSDGYDPERGSVRAWLMSTVHHRAVDLVRREEAQRRRAAETAPDAPPVDPGTLVVEEIGLDEDRAAVREALKQLPAEQRQVIELMYYGGQSQSQIAARLDIPLGTVKSRTLLGMRRLRAALTGMER
jgi:RNA polymerase sigma-70 factor, ECF subfamily